MNEDTKSHLLNVDTWIRFAYMVLFVLLLVLARMVIFAVALLQFLLLLLTGSLNAQLQKLGQGTAKWAYQAFLFLTYNSEDKPYPFADWSEVELPKPEVATDAGSEVEPEPATSSEDVPSFVTPQPHPPSESIDDQERDKG